MFLKNQKGISAVEMVIGSGLAMGLSIVVLKNMTQQSNEMLKNQQNLAMELTLKQVSDTLKRKTDCDQIVGGLRPNDINIISLDEKSEELLDTKDEVIKKECQEPISPEEMFPTCYRNDGVDSSNDDRNGGNLSQNQCNSKLLRDYKFKYEGLYQEYTKCRAEQQDTESSQPEVSDGSERLNKLNLDFEADMGGGFHLDKIDFKMSESAQGDTPLHLNFEFRKRNRVKDREDTILKRHIMTEVTVMQNGTVECPGFEREEISSAGLKSGCIALGGVFTEATKTCALTNLDGNLVTALKTAFCRSVSQGNGALAGGLCDQVTLVGNLQGQNIDPTYVEIRDLGNGGAVQRRTVLGNQKCANGFLRSVNTNGDINCQGVSFP